MISEDFIIIQKRRMLYLQEQLEKITAEINIIQEYLNDNEARDGS
jgi:hypothetical protein|tara:strand:- start:935 stop:1069 length:135 start_codon:yes stop_codon:yes gene_type:complete